MQYNFGTQYFEKIAVVRKLPYSRNKNRLLRDINRGDGGLVFIGSKDNINNTCGITFLNGITREQFTQMISDKDIAGILNKTDKIYHIPSKRWVTWQKFSELENMDWEKIINRQDEAKTS